MDISQEQITAFNESGFTVVSGLYSNDEISRMRKLVYDLYRKFTPNDLDLENVSDPWNALMFDAKLQEMRNTRPKDFGVLFDTAQGSYLFHQFVTSEAISAPAAELLGDGIENLACSGFLYRMDPPLDTRNTLLWHQDISYFPQNFHGENGLVISTALQDTPEELGALHVCKNSHKEGTVKPDYANSKAHGTSEQRALPDDVVARYPETICELKKGDTLFFNMNLFHSSGFNRSERIRFSTICRYHRIMTHDYVPFRVYHDYNDYAIERILSDHEGDHSTFRTFFEKG